MQESKTKITGTKAHTRLWSNVWKSVHVIDMSRPLPFVSPVDLRNDQAGHAQTIRFPVPLMTERTSKASPIGTSRAQILWSKRNGYRPKPEKPGPFLLEPRKDDRKAPSRSVAHNDRIALSILSSNLIPFARGRQQYKHLPRRLCWPVLLLLFLSVTLTSDRRPWPSNSS